MDARPAARRGGDGFRRDRPPHRRRPAARTGGARAPVPALRRRRRGPPGPARVHAAGSGDDRRRPDLRARFPHRAVGSPWRPAAAPRGGDTGPRPGHGADGAGPQRLVLRPRLRARPPGHGRTAGAAGSRAAPDGRPDRTARRDGAGPRRRRGVVGLWLAVGERALWHLVVLAADGARRVVEAACSSYARVRWGARALLAPLPLRDDGPRPRLRQVLDRVVVRRGPPLLPAA